MVICEFDIKTFGHVIRERRLDMQLTQKQAATLAGVSEATIMTLENGERYPMLDSVLKIAKALKIDELRIDTSRVLMPWDRTC